MFFDNIFIILQKGLTMQDVLTIDKKIYVVRGVQVMLDFDLAQIYNVPTKRINEQVKRNIERFDDDFMFQINDDEFDNLRSHFATTNLVMTRTKPFAFTEQGVYMLATVLKSQIAVETTKQIMRTFTKIKNLSVPYFDIIKRLEKLETNDKETKVIIQKVIKAISIIQDIQDDAQVHTKKIGFKIE
jgi:hypothetical protein